MTERYEWLAEPLPSDVARALERLERAPDVVHVAVMPDVHLAKEVCIGTVVATTASIYPAAVGGDAGCGVLAVATGLEADLLRDPGRAANVLAGFTQTVPIVKRRSAIKLPPAVGDPPLSSPTLEAEKRRTCRVQLGTLGRGNHFLELQSDDEDQLWVMVHSGSRGIGTAIRAFHESRAERVGGGLKRLDARSPEGAAYLSDHGWALAFAALNRRWIMDAALSVLESSLAASPVQGENIECHHNFVRTENHAGRCLIVHRKGAVSARAGEMGVIPGSMGTSSYHVEGRGDPRSLCSSSHGAGRCMSRTEAAKHISLAQVERELDGVFHNRKLLSALRDEAPSAYKDIDAVMRAQKGLLKIRRRLRPLLVHKGQ